MLKKMKKRRLILGTQIKTVGISRTDIAEKGLGEGILKIRDKQ